MKNLLAIGLFLVFATSCNQVQDEISQDLNQFQHPEYVLNAVNKHVQDDGVKEEVLASFEYDEGLYIADMDLSSLAAFTSDEMKAFLVDLLGAKLVILEDNAKSAGCPRNCQGFRWNPCMCKCSTPGYPSAPHGICGQSNFGSCTEWVWKC